MLTKLALMVLGSSNKSKVCDGKLGPLLPESSLVYSVRLEMQMLTLGLNSGCGDLTKWSFQLQTANPQGFQWYAKGNLPIGTKACVGRAVVSAGGSSPDGCTGAG